MNSDARLSVLVVEDDPGKKQKMFVFLRSRNDLFAEPDVCVSTAEAVKRMQERAYDLLILDVVVAAKPGGAPDEKHSLDLLDQLESGHGDVKKPRFVLPVSSVTNLSNVVKDYFRGRPWGVLAYQEESAQALLDIESVARWIVRQSDQVPDSRRGARYVIAQMEEPEISYTYKT
jgi:CheY-like chemotaxis protein